MPCMAIDLFCGIGGLTKGLSLAGIDVLAGFDIDGSCQFAYEANNTAEFICKDVSNISRKCSACIGRVCTMSTIFEIFFQI